MRRTWARFASWLVALVVATTAGCALGPKQDDPANGGDDLLDSSVTDAAYNSDDTGVPTLSDVGLVSDTQVPPGPGDCDSPGEGGVVDGGDAMPCDADAGDASVDDADAGAGDTDAGLDDGDAAESGG